MCSNGSSCWLPDLKVSSCKLPMNLLTTNEPQVVTNNCPSRLIGRTEPVNQMGATNMPILSCCGHLRSAALWSINCNTSDNKTLLEMIKVCAMSSGLSIIFQMLFHFRQPLILAWLLCQKQQVSFYLCCLNEKCAHLK